LWRPSRPDELAAPLEREAEVQTPHAVALAEDLVGASEGPTALDALPQLRPHVLLERAIDDAVQYWADETLGPRPTLRLGTKAGPHDGGGCHNREKPETQAQPLLRAQ
jgi:hypothetical protein